MTRQGCIVFSFAPIPCVLLGGCSRVAALDPGGQAGDVFSAASAEVFSRDIR